MTEETPELMKILLDKSKLMLGGIVFDQIMKLSDITLPAGWSWNQPNTVINPEAGTYTYWATYYLDDNHNPFTAELSIVVANSEERPIPPSPPELGQDFWIIAGAIVLCIGAFSLVMTSFDTKKQRKLQLAAVLNAAPTAPILTKPAPKPTAPSPAVSAPKTVPVAKPIIRAAAPVASAPTLEIKDGIYKNAALLDKGIVSVEKKTLASGSAVYEVEYVGGRKSKGGELLVKEYLHLFK